MTRYIAVARPDSVIVVPNDETVAQEPYLWLEVGWAQLGGKEGCADALADNLWKQIAPWQFDRDGTALTCEVEPIPVEAIQPANDNIRRVDVALALVDEDAREDNQRDIRSRVEFAMEFERDMRDRKDEFI